MFSYKMMADSFYISVNSVQVPEKTVIYEESIITLLCKNTWQGSSFLWGLCDRGACWLQDSCVGLLDDHLRHAEGRLLENEEI